MQVDKMHKFVILPSYYDAISELPKEKQDEFLGALVRYGVAGIEPEFSDPTLRMLFKLARPNLDSSVTHFDTQKKNANRGGRPKNPSKNPHENPRKNPNENPHKNPSKNRDSESECDSDSDSDMDSESECDNNLINQKEKIQKEKQPQKTSPVAVACATEPGLQANTGKQEFFEELARSQSGKDLKPKHKTSDELKVYLSAFNQLFGTKYRPVDSRLVKFKTRRKNLSLEDIITSLLLMSNEKYYKGDNDSNWRATPEYHLRNDTNITKFFEGKDDTEMRCNAREVIEENWEYYLAHPFWTGEEEM